MGAEAGQASKKRKTHDPFPVQNYRVFDFVEARYEGRATLYKAYVTNVVATGLEGVCYDVHFIKMTGYASHDEEMVQPTDMRPCKKPRNYTIKDQEPSAQEESDADSEALRGFEVEDEEASK